MFGTLEEAIALGDASKQRKNDGGVPLFEKRAVAHRVGEDVEWRDEYWVKIFNKGDPKNVIEASVTKAHQERWPNEWKAFLENAEPDIDGIPLDDFPKMTPAERQRCRQLKLRSVEDLVNYPDGQIKDLGSRGHELQRAAKDFLEYKSGSEVSDLKDQIAELKKELKSVTDSTKDNTERSPGSEPSEAVSNNSGKSKSTWKGGSNSGDEL